MKKAGISKKYREEIIAMLKRGEDLPRGCMYDLFPHAKAECELVYGGKEQEENILADTMSVPLQRVRLFGNNGKGWHNKLIFGDNLQAMKSLLDMKKRKELCNADGTPGIRLVYIDPPFATKQEMKSANGGRAYQDKLAAAEFLEFIRRRLILIRELLSDDGSIYVHLDWRMNSHIRILMDEIFGKDNFVNEIIWNYVSGGIGTKMFARKHDTVLFYQKSNIRLFNIQKERTRDYPKDKIFKDENGEFVWYIRPDTNPKVPMGVKSYVDKYVQDVWQIPIINPQAKERLDYPTQKPEALIDRIIKSSSNSGDLVADFFCGSGTTLAVAEKLGRQWIGADCGKLAIYTTQKRMFHLREEIGNTGKKIKPKPFALYNAGLYDFETLSKFPPDEWRRFALLLFGCQDKPHKIGGIRMDGYLKGSSVLVYGNDKPAKIAEDTLEEMHASVKGKADNDVYIIAPAMSFDFRQDYIDINETRYYALRIPYSIIGELHRREFTALSQPVSDKMVNEVVDSVGFDFIRIPEIAYDCGIKKRREQLVHEAFIRLKTFISHAPASEKAPMKGNRETLSMVMLNYDYDNNNGVFELDTVFYADDMRQDDWMLYFPKEKAGGDVMAIFIDIYGNEARELIPAESFAAVSHKKQDAKKRK